MEHKLIIEKQLRPYDLVVPEKIWATCPCGWDSRKYARPALGATEWELLDIMFDDHIHSNIYVTYTN